MSEFSEYAKRVNALALDTREVVQRTEKDYVLAEESRNRYPQKDGTLVPDEYKEKAARAALDYEHANHARNELRRNLPQQIEKQLNSIRAELSAAVDERFSAKAEDVDGATVELLQSGILRPSEYQRLVVNAVADGNYTMSRIIASYAEKAAVQTGGEDAMALRVIAQRGKTAGGGVYLANYDVLADALTRCVRNPALWPQWELMTERVIKNGF